MTLNGLGKRLELLTTSGISVLAKLVYVAKLPSSVLLLLLL